MPYLCQYDTTIFFFFAQILVLVLFMLCNSFCSAITELFSKTRSLFGADFKQFSRVKVHGIVHFFQRLNKQHDY